VSGQRGQHRIRTGPAAASSQVIRSYAKPRSRPAGVMRQCERGSDGGFDDGLLIGLLATN